MYPLDSNLCGHKESPKENGEWANKVGLIEGLTVLIDLVGPNIGALSGPQIVEDLIHIFKK